MWLIETGITVGLAAASWRFIETPILRHGFGATCRRWGRALADAVTRRAGLLGRALPVAVASAVLLTFATAGYGIAREPAPVAPSGLIRQVAQGQRVSDASQSPGSAKRGGPASRPGSSCRGRTSGVPGWQVSAVGDSVLLAAAAAFQADLPGAYIDARVGMQMRDGLAAIQALASGGRLRQVVVLSLGTNGTITAAQLRQLRRALGPDRDLVLVSTFDPQSWEPEVNAALAAASRARHTRLADWHKAIAGRTYLLWPDGIHPRPDGARLYAHLVLTAIRAVLRSHCRRG
jgi:hypothetical protein